MHRPRCHHTVSTSPSMYLNSSHDSRDFPMPATPVIETTCALRSSAVAWKSSLGTRNSRPDRRTAIPARSSGATASERDHSHGAESACVSDLPLSSCSPGISRRWPLQSHARRFGHQDRSRRSRGLDARGRVHEVAGNHPLPLGAQSDGGLTGGDARPEGERRRPHLLAERGHGSDEVERRAHRALGVVFLRDRCAPYRHDGVTDELLDVPP